ncbi:hypothetical protein DPEC_G00225680 [Dallia pectoralis]|uniref:Uncharacterized protein n=1 Tax=Dallia pectoralis TaxID=75939 RepID=A0ACC2G0G8_DALPE|nr:hypothetical protein DPEC_G00225680 [Dallia pectoralis]
MRVLDCHFSVPTLIVDGQQDDLIIGSNVIKHLIRTRKLSESQKEKVPTSRLPPMEEETLLQLLTTVEKWRGEEVPSKVGTVKLRHAVTLEPMKEHLMWGRLPSNTCLSAGSTVVVEPSESQTVPRTVIVGRIVTPLWGDGWVPVRVINPTHKPVTLRRNCKIADVSPCVSLEDFDNDNLYETDKTDIAACNVARTVQTLDTSSVKSLTVDSTRYMPRPANAILNELGLRDIDIDSTDLSPFWKGKLVNLIAKYESIFSRHSLDCGKATGFVHRIRLSDSRPFRLPYRRLSPSHYDKLRTALNEMEERDIIRKSTSEYASPLVLAWKKNGDLRLCTDFRWLNARTIKDAHPLPHQAEALAALGGNAFFSTMDLTSGFYNVEVHEEDKKLTRTRKKSDWTPECGEAFRMLKQALLDNAALAHPDFNRPFLLSVDASSNGLGAVLSQLSAGDDVARPIAFASKSLNYAQSRYPAHRLEFLALKWAVCDKFSRWLRGQMFTVWTDNNPLTYILSKPKLDASEQWWVAKLAPFDFEIRYIPGPKNVVADALSREPFVQPSILRRLTRVPYGALVEEANALYSDCVQDAFRWSCDPEAEPHMPNCSTVASQNAATRPCNPSISKEAVSAVLKC